MNDYIKLVKMLRYCANDEPLCQKEDECPYYNKEEDSKHWYYCVERMMLDAANAIEDLYKAASSMHTYIFLNSADEQEAYDKCHLTDKMNEALGYYGNFEIQTKEAEK